jgi:hypothetical protein
MRPKQSERESEGEVESRSSSAMNLRLVGGLELLMSVGFEAVD